MATPYKMTGHTLPGIKQRKPAPAKFLGITALMVGKALVAAGAGAAVNAGVGAITGANRRKKIKNDNKIAAAAEQKRLAAEKTQEAMEGDKSMGKNNSLID